ncbi:unnamed protein product [Menidia menidia]|uniref:(Atlantic silverside) hypothetical protein n=1 Tax=Menidia menidia TaxID=238744 RepID=A0A8S4BAX1_9TELE|nr:unnamed protein product [Menidia menidia]
MSQLSSEDEAELQSLLKQLLGSINDKISCASSTECAEEILLHLEETDKNFHKYMEEVIESTFSLLCFHHEQSSSETEKILEPIHLLALLDIKATWFNKWTHGYYSRTVVLRLLERKYKSLQLFSSVSVTVSPVNVLAVSLTPILTQGRRETPMMESLKNSMTVVVESLINKFEEDQQRKEMNREREYGQSNSQFTDNCSDSDSSFNQSYAFIRQEQLQVLAEKLDSNKPKEVRRDALRVLCGAPPSDVLSCESWSTLRRNLCAALNEPHLNENVLQFFAKSFSSSPLNVTREIYTSLAQSVESSFRTLRLSFPIGSATIDTHRPEVTRLLKQIRLMNDFQKEVTTYWIRHPEKYMEEVIESTFSLLCFHHEQSASETEKILEPIHLLALLDIKATWFNKWTHGYYSRTVVLRLLERKYKSLIVAALQQCVCYSESCERVSSEPNPDPHPGETRDAGSLQRSVYSGKELEYSSFVHSLCILGKLIIYTHGRKLFPIKMRKRRDPVDLTDLVVILITIMYRHPNPPGSDPSLTDSLSPSSLVMEVLCTLCDWDQCAAECLHQASVVEALLAPITALLSGQQVKLKSPVSTLTLVADVLARIANTDRGLALFLYEKNLIGAQGERTSAAHVIVQFTLRLLDEALPPLSQSQALCGAFIFVCRQIYNTCEGLQVLRPYGLHEAIAAAWRKVGSVSERGPTPVKGSTQETTDLRVWEETLLDSLLNFAATPRGLTLLHQTGALPHCVSHMFSRLTKKLQVISFVRTLVAELWSAVECGSDDVRVVQPRPTPMDPMDRSCLKPFLSLVNLLSSSQSVVELLGLQPLANKSAYSLRETPTSIPDLIDRLIAVNSDVKIHSLFHYEQSHTFGLR